VEVPLNFKTKEFIWTQQRNANLAIGMSPI